MNCIRLTTLLCATAILICIADSSFAQGEASGGRIPKPPAKPKTTDSPAKPKTTDVPNEAAPAKTTAGTRSRQPATLDRIDGKWLTTGNDFGASELILTQNGANISGVIQYTDGRTGTLTGTLKGKRLFHTFTTSNGDSGSGWLELSWINFLGGSWRNDRVRDGSWTLNRIEGQWCLGGDRNRIRRVTHDAAGRLTIITETGAQQAGSLNYQNWPYLNTPNGDIKGSVFYKSTRIDWADGTFWTWCGR
jgi:hypothetical protein